VHQNPSVDNPFVAKNRNFYFAVDKERLAFENISEPPRKYK